MTNKEQQNWWEETRPELSEEEFRQMLAATWAAIEAGEPCSEDYIRYHVWRWPEYAPEKYRRKYKWLIMRAKKSDEL